MPLRLPHTTPVYLTADIRRIEQLAAAASEPPALMERAGLAAAELAREIAGEQGRRILVVAGPGNNGGDAFVIARHLRQWWFDVTVVYCGDESRLSADALAALRAWRDAGGSMRTDIPHARWDLAVDGLFGIGLQRDVDGRYAELIDRLNAGGAPVVAVDVPSGLDSDTGRVLGRAVQAAHTLTFIGLKPGLLTLDGPDHCGKLHLATLGLDAAAMVSPKATITGPGLLDAALPPRRLNTHKGSYGSVAIVGGARGMVGAALLAGRAALKLGSGRVYLGLLGDDAPAVDAGQPELMVRTTDELPAPEQLDCIAVGPGLSRSQTAAAVLERFVRCAAALVLDADALNLLGENEALHGAVSARKAATVLTPHPAEAARLLACSTAEVQRDRVAAALSLARAYQAGVVLKGAGSICAWPDGTWAVNVSGNPGMASAGMGDVLTGLIAALLAQKVAARSALLDQHMAAKSALLTAVYLHGAAADALVTQGSGPVGLAAGELIDAARSLINTRRA